MKVKVIVLILSIILENGIPTFKFFFFFEL